MPDGKEVPYWNTFYQEVKYHNIGVQQLMRGMDIQYSLAERLVEKVNASLNESKQPKEIDFSGMERYREKVIELLESCREYLGQMDLNIKSPLVWEFYEDTLKKLRGYGAQIVRLDAFAYAPKEPGEKNFLNDPGTWDLLKRIKELADQYELTLLPEIHSRYEEKIHERLAQEGYMTYDFFLPGLIIDALDRQTNEYLLHWAKELKEKDIRVVNMLGCHDGIPLLDLKGLIPDETIEELIRTVVARGGYVKDLHGKKNVYYQVNSTYYSALGEDDRKLLLARAIQLFMPGKPQVWYLDLFAGKNDYEAVQRAGAAGHKEINRTNLSPQMIQKEMKNDIVQQQLSLLRFRNTCPAFGFDAKLQIVDTKLHMIKVRWENQGYSATLEADLATMSFDINATDPEGGVIYQYMLPENDK
jgi:sucrose phosphorylase